MKTTKSFLILCSAARKSRGPMWQVIKVLLVITVVLAFLYYIFEGIGQPEHYGGALGLVKSFVWAFLQYIGMLDEIAGPVPVTAVGKVIAVIIGLLNILIIAIPAGMIGSNYADAMAEDRQNEEIGSVENNRCWSFEGLLRTSCSCAPRGSVAVAVPRSALLSSLDSTKDGRPSLVTRARSIKGSVSMLSYILPT